MTHFLQTPAILPRCQGTKAATDLTRSDGRPVYMLLAHGAMGAMDTPVLDQLSTALAETGITVARFEFPYMAARREDGKRRPPPRAEMLIPAYQEALADFRDLAHQTARILIGGKSLGGRVASLIADDAFRSGAVDGLVCFGYPFHPPKRPDNLRTAHLEALDCPTLIIQGTRDPFGTQADVAGYALSSRIKMHWLDDGDHDFKPRKASGTTQAEHLVAAAAATNHFSETLGLARTST